MTRINWPLPATAEDDDEADRQMILLALAELSIRRPGWEATLRRLARLLSGESMFNQFRQTSGRVSLSEGGWLKRG